MALCKTEILCMGYSLYTNHPHTSLNKKGKREGDILIQTLTASNSSACYTILLLFRMYPKLYCAVILQDQSLRNWTRQVAAHLNCSLIKATVHPMTIRRQLHETTSTALLSNSPKHKKCTCKYSALITTICDYIKPINTH